MVKIDSGPLEATDKFEQVPKDKWFFLMLAKRDFLSTNLAYDCRCLVEFCEEAELVYADCGFSSAAEMIQHGYELDPVEIELAVAWLKHNQPASEVGLGAVKLKITEAKANPLASVGKIGNGRPSDSSVGNSNSTIGNTNEYLLRRLARDQPELLDKIETGELTVNQAAIQAGIRKKPTPAEIVVKTFAKVENRLETLRSIVGTLSDSEREVIKDWFLS